MSIEITHVPTQAQAGLGLLTPEATLKTATVLNNDFLRLDPIVRNTKFAREFGSLYAGWKADYAKLRGSYFERLTEFGKVAKWQEKFDAFKAKVDAAGVDTSVIPVRVPGATFKVPITEAEALITRAEAISQRAKGTAGGLSGAMAFLGIAVLGGAAIWYLSRRGRGATAGVGLAGVPKVTVGHLRQLIRTNNKEYGTNFSLGGAYGNYELWANGNRLEAGSKRDVYETFVRYRFSEKYRTNK